MKLLRPASIVFALVAGCSDPVSGNGPGPVDAATRDVPVVMDLPVVIDTGPPPVDSGCPASPRITPDNLPADYLPAQRVTYIRAVDGDTAHFAFPIVGEVTVRFLWMNAEETHGAETTAFGLRTAAEVARIMGGAGLFQVAKHRARAGSTEPELDQFGRTLGLVFMDGELLQARLIREGWSAYYTDFGCATQPIHTALLYAEAEARANRRGIWAPGHPTNYAPVFARWIGPRGCRPNPFTGQRYCN